MTKSSLITQVRVVDADEEDDTVNLSDPFRPTGPYGVAKACEAKIIELEALRATVTPSKRRAINKWLHILRDLVKWCQTRAGYVEPESQA